MEELFKALIAAPETKVYVRVVGQAATHELTAQELLDGLTEASVEAGTDKK